MNQWSDMAKKKRAGSASRKKRQKPPHRAPTRRSTPDTTRYAWLDSLIKIARRLKPGLPWLKTTLLGILVVTAGVNFSVSYTEDASGRTVELSKTGDALAPGIFWACMGYAIFVVIIDAWVYFQLQREELRREGNGG